MTVIAVDLLLDFVEDARPELSDVSTKEFPASTKAWTPCMPCCFCCHTDSKLPIRGGLVPLRLESLIVQVHAGKVAWVSPL